MLSLPVASRSSGRPDTREEQGVGPQLVLGAGYPAEARAALHELTRIGGEQ